MRFRFHSMSLLLTLVSVGASVPCALNCAGVLNSAPAQGCGCCPEQAPDGDDPCGDPACPGGAPVAPREPSGTPCSPFLCISWSCPLAPVDAGVTVEAPTALAVDAPADPATSAADPSAEFRSGDAERSPPLRVVHRRTRSAIALLHPHAV